MTAPTLKLSDLRGPDADGWADVGYFADIDDYGRFVLDANRRCVFADGSSIKIDGSVPVVRVGRGRWMPETPARIEMEGEADLAEQVRMLREVVAYAISQDHVYPRLVAALAATAPKEAAK